MASNLLLTQTLCLFPKSSVGAKPWTVSTDFLPDSVLLTCSYHVRVFLFVFGYSRMLMLPSPQLRRGIYIDENALQPGQASHTAHTLSLVLTVWKLL